MASSSGDDFDFQKEIELENGLITNKRGYGEELEESSEESQSNIFNQVYYLFMRLLKGMDRVGFYLAFLFFAQLLLVALEQEKYSLYYKLIYLFGTPIILSMIIKNLIIFLLWKREEKLNELINQQTNEIIVNLKAEELMQSNQSEINFVGEIQQKKSDIQDFPVLQKTMIRDIKVGDFVVLKHGQISPADILIVNMKDVYCTIDSIDCTGKTSNRVKKSIQLTKNLFMNSFFSYQSSLTGIVLFEYFNDQGENTVKGFIKLKKDPKGERFRDENIIFRGQKMMFTQWAIGIVLNVGQNCQYYSYQQRNNATSVTHLTYIYEQINSLEKYLFFSSIAIALFLQLINRKDSAVDDPSDLSNSKSEVISFLHTLFQLLIFAPSWLRLSINLISLQYILLKKVTLQNRGGNQEDVHRIETVAINHPLPFRNLFYTTHALMEKTGVLTEAAHYTIQGAYINNMYYDFDQSRRKNSLDDAKDGKKEAVKKQGDDNLNKQNQDQQSDSAYALVKNVDILVSPLSSPPVLFDKEEAVGKQTNFFKRTKQKNYNALDEQVKQEKTHEQQELEDEGDGDSDGGQNELNSENQNQKMKYLIQINQKEQEDETNQSDLQAQPQTLDDKAIPVLESSHEQQIDKQVRIAEPEISSPVQEEEEQEEEYEEKQTAQTIFKRQMRQEQKNEKKRAELMFQSKNDLEAFFKGDEQEKSDIYSDLKNSQGNIQKIRDNLLTRDDFIDELENVKSLNRSQIRDFLISMILCHTSKSQVIKDFSSVSFQNPNEDTLIHQSLLNQEKLIREFAGQFGFEFSCASQNQGIDYFLKIKQKFLHSEQKISSSQILDKDCNYQGDQFEYRKFNLAIPPFYNKDKSTVSLIFLEAVSGKVYLHVKDEVIQSPSYLKLSLSEESVLNKNLKFFLQRGCVPVIYSVRQLTSQDLHTIIQQREDFVQKVNTQVKNQEELLSQAYNEIQKDMILLGVLGMSEKMQEGTAETLNSLRKNQIQTWMITGDTLSRALSIAYRSSLIQNTETSEHSFYINNPNEVEIKVTLRRILGLINQVLQYTSENLDEKDQDQDKDKEKEKEVIKKYRDSSKFNRIPHINIFLSGNTIVMIEQIDYLHDHFKFILNFTNTLIGYQFNGMEQLMFAKLLKNSDVESVKIIGLLNNLEDASYEQYLDLSISINNQNDIFKAVQGGQIEIKNSNNNRDLLFTNIQLQKIKMIVDFLLPESIKFNEQIERLIDFNINLTFCVGFMNLLWYIQYNHQGNIIFFQNFQSSLVYLWAQSLIPSLIIMINHKNDSDDYGGSRQNLNNFLQCKEQIQQKSIFANWIESNFQVLILFSFNILGLQYVENEQGRELKDEDIKLILLLEISAVVNWKLVSQVKNKMSKLYLSVSWFFLMIVFLMTYYNDGQSVFDNVISLNYGLIAYIISTVFVSIIGSYIVRSIRDIKKKEKKQIEVKRTQEQGLALSERRSVDRAGGQRSMTIIRTLSQIPDFSNTIKTKNIDIGKLIGKVFRGSEIDMLILDLNSNYNLNSRNSPGTAFWNNFKSKDLERSFITRTFRNFNLLFKEDSVIPIICFEVNILLFYVLKIIFTGAFESQYDYLVLVMISFFILNQWRSFKDFKNSMYTKYLRNFAYSQTLRVFLILAISFFLGNLRYLEVSSLFILSFSCFIFISLKYTAFLFLFQVVLDIFFFFLVSNKLIDQSMSTQEKIFSVFGHILMMFSVFATRYRQERTLRQEFLKDIQFSNYNKKINDIMSILLPKFIRDQIQAGNLAISEDQGKVAILFCDIVDFDKIITKQREKVVKLLDNLFREFDTLCQSHKVQKIETVGQTYMSAAGLSGILNEDSKDENSSHQNPVNKIIYLALEMMNIVKNFSYGDQEKIQIKIGIHYGRVMAGLIGYHKPQFSLIGDTVNMTSRVCSTGNQCKITLSESAYLEVQEIPELVYLQKEVYAKGKGMIQTYEVVMRKQNLKRRLTIGEMSMDTKNFLFGSNKLMKLANAPKEHKSISTLPNKQTPTVMISSSKEGQVIKKSRFSQRPPTEQDEPEQEKKIEEKKEQTIPTVQDVDDEEEEDQKNMQGQDDVKKSLSNQELVEIELKKFGPQQVSDFSENNSFINAQNSKTPNHQKSKVILDLEIQVKEHISVPRTDNNHLFNQNIIYQNALNSLKMQSLTSELQQKEGEEFQKLELITNTFKQLVVQLFEEKEDFLLENLKSSGEELKGMFVSLVILSSIHYVFIINSSIQTRFDNYLFPLLSILFSLIGLILIKTLTKTQSLNIVKNFILFNLILSLVGFFKGESIGQDQLSNSNQNIQPQTNFFPLLCSILILFVANVKVVSLRQKCLIRGGILLFWCFSLFFHQEIDVIKSFEDFIYIFSALVLVTIQCFRMAQIEKNQYLRIQNSKSQLSQQNEMLMNLLPLHVLDKFFDKPNKKLELTDKMDNVTILFADIAGFTAYSAAREPEQVVKMLRLLFTEFDRSCVENDVYQVYTIGDCYVGIGTKDANNRDPPAEAYRLVSLAFQMIEIIQKVRKEIEFNELDMRIGIHTGSLIGGIMGTGIIRYDIYGPNVVIANQMESSGEPGRILISEDTQKILSESFPGEFRYEESQNILVNAAMRCVSTFFLQQN